MKNKITKLLKVNFLYEQNEEELDSEIIEKFENEIINKCEEIGAQYNLKWESSSFIVLDKETMNCGNCEKCGCWVTDLDKEGVISELNRGAVYDGKLLCDECLPPDHKYAF
jgi:hypothetical protein